MEFSGLHGKRGPEQANPMGPQRKREEREIRTELGAITFFADLALVLFKMRFL